MTPETLKREAAAGLDRHARALIEMLVRYDVRLVPAAIEELRSIASTTIASAILLGQRYDRWNRKTLTARELAESEADTEPGFKGRKKPPPPPRKKG